MIDEILSFNRDFVARKAYEPFVTDKYPAKKLAVLTCMDTRLTELLPQALGLRNGDAKIIKNAGGLVLFEADSAIRSLLVAIYELGVEEVMVVHHSGCGACHMSYAEFKPHMVERGIPQDVLAAWEEWGIADWLEGFHDTEASVRKTVAAVRHHSLMPKDVVVRGFIIDSVTGALTEVDCPEEGCHCGCGGSHEEGCGCGGHEGEACGCGGGEGHHCHHGEGEECHHGDSEGGHCHHGGHGGGCRRHGAQTAARVDAMSWAFDRVSVAMRLYLGGADDPAARAEVRKALEPFQDEIAALDYYQRSGLWQQDYEAEEAGRLPADIRRSVLSQDGLYNLLEEIGFVCKTN